MAALRWYEFRHKYPSCHVVVASIPSEEPLVPDPRAGHVLLLRQIKQLEISCDYAVSVVRDVSGCAIHCAFEGEAEAALFAESVAATPVQGSATYATAWEFKFDTGTVWMFGGAPSPAKAGGKRRTSLHRIGWRSFRETHPMAHLVSAVIVPPWAALDLARLQGFLGQLIEGQAPRRKFSTSIVRGPGGVEIHCGFAEKADADHLAETMNAQTAAWRDGWSTHRSFHLDARGIHPAMCDAA